jgi:hypothetical protein
MEHMRYVELMIPFSHLGVGKTFGDLALQGNLDEKNYRAANVYCREKC